jgi:uncharacterized protein YecE (DUF72 family)
MSIRVGISGWKYKGWRGSFYPPHLPPSQELEFASQHMLSIEINGTFYSLQSPTSYQRWYSTSPDNFIFSVKANRYITHVKRLKDPEIPLANFFASGILSLKEKLGPILWQFPPTMSFNPERWDSFLPLLPRDFLQAAALAQKHQLPVEKTAFKIERNFPLYHAIEIRHNSFLNPWFIELLRRYNHTLVFADTAGKWPYMEDITGDIVYIRLHGDSELYVSGYDDSSLEFWKKRIQLWHQGKEPVDKLTISDNVSKSQKRDIYIYFDNDAKVRAPTDAQNLIHRLGLA